MLCDRKVQPKRVFGVGTLFMLIVSWGMWAMVMWISYKKRCPICKGDALKKLEV